MIGLQVDIQQAVEIKFIRGAWRPVGRYVKVTNCEMNTVQIGTTYYDRSGVMILGHELLEEVC